MGTKVQNLPGYYSMRDLNEESSSCGWPLFYGDKTLTNGQCYNNYLSSATTGSCTVYDKDFVKHTMLEHEAVFKNQVYELHRLYRIQRDLMNEVKRKELHKNQMLVEASFSTVPSASQITTEDGQKWHVSRFPVGGSTHATSVSGAEGIHSPLGSSKGVSKQAGLFPSPNGCSSKDVEVLESRPSKVRRKMFDLQLPADEYIDTEEIEKSSDEKISGPASFLPDRNCTNGKEGDEKHFCGNGGRTGSQVQLEQQSLGRINGLADLNEPVQVEETDDSPHIFPLSRNPCEGTTECSDPSAAAKQKSEFIGFSRDHFLNSHDGTDSWTRNNRYLENNGSGKGWSPSVAEAGQAKSNTQFVTHALKLEKSILSSQAMQDARSKAREPAFDYFTGRSKPDLWSERTIIDLDVGERNHQYSINKHPESVVPLHRPGFFADAHSSDLLKSWSHSASSWEVASSTLSQKLMSVQKPPCQNASGVLSRSSQSHQSNGVMDDNWPLNINSKPNPGIRCDLPMQNGFYPGSSSRSKESSMNISSISYDHVSRNNDCKIFSEHFISNVSSKYYMGSNSNCNDIKSGKDIDLNVLLSKSSSNALVSKSSIGIMNGEQKHEEHRAVLPWLRAKTTSNKDTQNADKGIIAAESSFCNVPSMFNRDESGKGPSGKFLHNGASVSCSNDIEPRRTVVCESSSSKKILGFPIFDMPHISSKKESSSITSPSVSIPNLSNIDTVENNRKNRILDINLPCDAAFLELDNEAVSETIVVSKKRSPSREEANSRNQFDLNLSMSEDEASLPTIPSDKVNMKVEIDLEAPAVLETEDDAVPEEKQLETSPESPQAPKDTVEQPQDDPARSAAEAIVVMSSLPCNQVEGLISSPSESAMIDPLSWFVDIVSSCKDNNNLESSFDILRGKCVEDNEQSSSEEMDYFEAMTLKLTETKEEDYMPKPLVPESFKVEEAATVLPSRARKGPARRGRQRRDFQRDILPGLLSLSRHEVTEDLQTFGGIMKATGHSWNSGLTRRSSSRNGCGRGRRRVQVIPSPPRPAAINETFSPLMQQLTNAEVGLEDRSLTGWGKTTRRPRRQRCPAGNPPSIPLT